MNLIKKEYENQYQLWANTALVGLGKSAIIVETVGKGFKNLLPNIREQIDWTKLNKDSWVLVLNDFDLTQTKEFYNHGITNIVFLSTDTSKDEIVFNYFFSIVYKSKNFKKMLEDTNLPWKAVLRLRTKEQVRLTKKGKPVKDKEGNWKYETVYTIEGDTNNFMAKHFNAIVANPPFALGNDITQFIISHVSFDEGTFTNVLPISKFKKESLHQFVVPTSIRQTAEANSSSEFGGADTYPIICRISKTRTNNLSFAEFERKYCVNREEEYGKKFFEEQDRRIEAELTGTSVKPFVAHDYMITAKRINNYNSKTSVMMNIWTPHFAHGWGAMAIYKPGTTELKESNYVDWNFKKVNKDLKDVFNVTASGDIGQTATVFRTEQEKDNFLKWWHSAELNGKYRHCGLSTILLRWMNKSTCCPYDYIIPRVDFSRPWTDEEILKDYGYTDAEIEKILHYNDDRITAAWLKGQKEEEAE